MSKTSRKGVVLIACVLACAGWGSNAMAADTPVPADIQIVLTDPAQEPDLCSGEESLPAEELAIDSIELVNPDDSEAVCSPPPQCFRDRDCDSICGKRLGVCRRVNSRYSECICSVA